VPPPPSAPLAEHAPLDGLAAQALENLVNQFARPLDFLRELVQNSIDAGSPRVEIWLSWAPDEQGPDGVLEIHVDDWGEGMDEEIIDKQLTRLFSSTKEDDLTKIGKFGIGFTSIFAIRPEAVLLRTGRLGESWELLFHPDRSFDKVRLHEPVAGTRITLFKRMPGNEVDAFVRESRWVLRFWCEHSNTPVLFDDRTRRGSQPGEEAADPFAAFQQASPSHSAEGPEAVNGPMQVEADLSIEHVQDGVQVVVGYSPRPRYGFYNGGLTLMSTENEDALGRFVHRMRHLSFKVKCDTLEHTLTRDNVLQDTHWEQAMAVLSQASLALQRALLVRTARAVEQGEDLGRWHRYLAVECRARALHTQVEQARTTPLLRDHLGRPLTLDQLEAAHQEHGATLLHPGAGPLADALGAQGVALLHDDPDLRELLDATWRPPFFALRLLRRRIVRADELYVLPQPIPAAEQSRQERQLLERAQLLVQQSVGGRLDLRIAEFPGGADEALVVEGGEGEGVFRRAGRRWRWLPGLLHRRTLLLNRHHPYLLSQVVLAGERPHVAAYALAHALLDAEGVEGEGTFRALADAAWETLAPAGEAG
jgi:hypothetical protein